MRLLRMGHHQILAQEAYVHRRRLGHSHRTALRLQPALQPSRVDHHHRRTRGHRHWQDDLWRLGVQPLQPGTRRALLPARLIPGADDLVAAGGAAHKLRRRHHRGNTAKHHEDGHQDRRPVVPRPTARLHDHAPWKRA